jgi:hypothetical protein
MHSQMAISKNVLIVTRLRVSREHRTQRKYSVSAPPWELGLETRFKAAVGADLPVEMEVSGIAGFGHGKEVSAPVEVLMES